MHVFVNTEAKTHVRAVDMIKLNIASHSSAVKPSNIHAILKCNAVVTFDDQQWFHHMTPLPKKRLSYSMSQDEQSITVASCVLVPVASREHSGMTSCVSALPPSVADDSQVDRDNIDEERSITVTSGVSALARVASGEQDHVSSGVSALACLAGDVGEGIQTC
jgi:hypothetical protein